MLRKGKFGILGAEEYCTGDSAKRIGNEYLAQNLIFQNIKIFNRYGVKKIITSCPHGYNTIKNEYPQYGGNYSIVHHTIFIHELLRTGKLKVNHLNRKMEKENNERDRWLTKDEEKRLLESSPEWLREIMVFALNTGLRQGEILSLEWSRVDFERKTILIQKTKNGKPRTIPLNQSALNVLAQRSKVKSIKSDIVFINSRGTKIDKSNLAKVFNNAVKEVKISNFMIHVILFVQD